MLDQVISIFAPLFIIKIIAVIFVIMLLMFMLIVAKQVRDMEDTITIGPSGKLVQLVSYLSVILAVSLLLTAIAIL